MSRGLRTIRIGFSPRKGTDGEPEGSAVIKYKPRNAYELLGLRKPPRPQMARA